jgi:hypothetical protein
VAYFNFTKIAPPAPNDPNVNEVTQLNDNWDHLDSKLSPYMSGGALTGLETGQEVFASGFRFAVYDGSGVRSPDDIDAAWSGLVSLRAGEIIHSYGWWNFPEACFSMPPPIRGQWARCSQLTQIQPEQFQPAWHQLGAQAEVPPQLL